MYFTHINMRSQQQSDNKTKAMIILNKNKYKNVHRMLTLLY